MYRHTIVKYTRRVFSTVARANSSRCIDRLMKEHVRIISTFRSFNKMLNKMQNQSRNDIVPVQQVKDVQKYIEFVNNYQNHHHQKEELVYAKLIAGEEESDVVVALFESVQDEHNDENIGLRRMQKISDLLDSHPTKISYSDIIDPSLDFIQSMKNHIFEEEKDIYPYIRNKFNDNQINEIDQICDQVDAKNAEMVNTMELLSDELIKNN